MSRTIRWLSVATILVGLTGSSAQIAKADPINLGTAGNYALVDLGMGTQLGLNSGPIAGNVLLGNGVNAAFSGGNNGKITGTLFYDSTVTGTGTFSQLNTAPTTKMVSTTVTQQALTDAQNASAAASALKATQNFGSITKSTTITGNGGTNVIDVASIQNAPLTLSGNKNDFFIFNVTGNISMNVAMTLSGVNASHILFNMTGASGTTFSTSGGNKLYGTFLATKGVNFQFSNLDLTGALINTDAKVQFVSGCSIPTFVPFQSTPEPSTMLLAITCMGGLLLPGGRGGLRRCLRLS